MRQQIVASEPAGSSKLDLSVVTVTIFSPEQLEGTMELSAAEREFHETFNAAFDASAKETDARDFHQHMTPPVRGRGVPKDDWTQYELAGGRIARSDLPIIIPKKRDSTWHRDFEGIDEFCAMPTHISLESWD